MNESEVRVDYASIEKSLAELWRGENKPGEEAVTRAALWNVIAHTWNAPQQSHASETLSRVAAAVPQRTIVIRSEPKEKGEIASWISANCHMIGGAKQVCSEEVAIVAGGEGVHRVPPLVSALLLPDMPVAVWWLGDLPTEHQAYVETLLDPADRLIVDSSHFDSAEDMKLLSRIARQTTTAPADLNWVRLEEWRAATAALFDDHAVRQRLHRIRRIRVVGTTNTKDFGDSAESLLFAAWLSVQAGHRVHDDGRVESGAGTVAYDLSTEAREEDHGSLCKVEIEFDDGNVATVTRDDQQHVLIAAIDGISQVIDCVTRVRARGLDDLIVRQLKRPEADRLFVKVLPEAAKLAPRAVA